ncbi:MAG: hypothetical protein GTN89_15550 [Acidobacteria bacterium]|nr:hypothetical protein [Acidobacteriota bacterium]NIM62368.1 hypothetical protein [Acidobacteriota bacterium]NIO60677.1 hypothetical protein [Acidobacteriota bacterium]NIQ31743.1 hypothetical protein [Acidobacteriota bacterium]NIQ87048.1 hypothetical protein [Acidobacteriota bacterium]
MDLPPKDLDELSLGNPWLEGGARGASLPSRTDAERCFLWLGASLTLLGPLAFFVSSEVGAAAFVPMVFGLALIALSLVSLQSTQAWRWNLLALIAVVFALADGLRGLRQVPGLVQGLALPNLEAIVTQSITAVLCLTFLAPILVRLFEKVDRQAGATLARPSR